MIEPLSKRVNDLGWHIQINAPAATIMEIMPILEKEPSPIVFDHLAHIPEPEGISHPLFARVRALIDKGTTWVKLSGAHADTKVGPPTYSDSSAIARAYVVRRGTQPAQQNFRRHDRGSQVRSGLSGGGRRIRTLGRSRKGSGGKIGQNRLDKWALPCGGPRVRSVFLLRRCSVISGAQLEDFGVTATFFRDGEKFLVRTDGPDGALHGYPIAYTIGVCPLQQYLVAFPGRYQALAIAWDSRPKGQGGRPNSSSSSASFGPAIPFANRKHRAASRSSRKPLIGRRFFLPRDPPALGPMTPAPGPSRPARRTRRSALGLAMRRVRAAIGLPAG
jgi:hypothetical protein